MAWVFVLQKPRNKSKQFLAHVWAASLYEATNTRLEYFLDHIRCNDSQISSAGTALICFYKSHTLPMYTRHECVKRITIDIGQNMMPEDPPNQSNCSQVR